jgi:uncharacterized integral membrane protein
MSTQPEQQPTRGSREKARTLGLVLVAVVATLFAVLNTGSVEVNWIFGSGHAPLIIVIVISVLAGIVLTYMAERISRRHKN